MGREWVLTKLATQFLYCFYTGDTSVLWIGIPVFSVTACNCGDCLFVSTYIYNHGVACIECSLKFANISLNDKGYMHQYCANGIAISKFWYRFMIPYMPYPKYLSVECFCYVCGLWCNAHGYVFYTYRMATNFIMDLSKLDINYVVCH